MKNLLQVLLVSFALALCALVALQWHRESALRQRVQSLDDDMQKQRATATKLSSSANHADAEILRLNGLKNQFSEAVQTSQEEIARLKTELKTSQAKPEQLDDYQKALDTANARIASQNDELRRLAAEHNEVVLKFNKMADEYNELVKKWNALERAETNATSNNNE